VNQLYHSDDSSTSPAKDTSQGRRRTLTSRTMDNKERKAYDAAIIDYQMNIDIMQERL
jgi:hypothetical protein